MAGTINLAFSQRFGVDGLPLAGGQLFFYAAGTNTPQSAYYDSGLTLPLPNPLTLDAAGNIPFFWLADGVIKVILTDRFGVVQQTGDNIPVQGSSSGGGGGGGGTVDPTTVLSTGDIKHRYATGSLTGFTRMNGRTIGSASSGATERANSDTQALFVYLWLTDANLAVSGGRGSDGPSDYSANKTIALPDWRGRVIAGLDDMGNTAAGRLTSSYFGATATTLGATGGLESQTLTAGQLPAQSYLLQGVTDGIVVTSQATNLVSGTIQAAAVGGGGSNYDVLATTSGGSAARASTGTFTPSGTVGPIGNGFPHPIVQPTVLSTYYIKL